MKSSRGTYRAEDVVHVPDLREHGAVVGAAKVRDGTGLSLEGVHDRLERVGGLVGGGNAVSK